MGDLAIPIAYPDFRAHSDEINHDVPSGHAGILFVDGKHGTTNYFEYGRYDPPVNHGLVQQQHVPDAKMSGGAITVRSLKLTFKALSQKSGHNGRLLAAWIEVDDGGFEKMRTFCLQTMNDPARKAYSITTNNCCTFARDVAANGGATMPLPLTALAYASAWGPFGVVVANAVTASPIPDVFLGQLLTVYPGLEFKPSDNWSSAGLRSIDVS